MKELIERQAAIETLKKLLYETALVNSHDAIISDVYAEMAENRIETWVNLIPPAPQWISVTERFPEEDKDVLVTVYFMGLEQNSNEWGWNDHIKPSYYAVLEDLGGYELCGRFFVRCSKCDIAQDNLWSTKQTAIKRWNRRTNDERLNQQTGDD